MKLEFFLLFSLFVLQSLAFPALTEQDKPSDTQNSEAEDAYIINTDSEKEEQGDYYFILFSFNLSSL